MNEFSLRDFTDLDTTALAGSALKPYNPALLRHVKMYTFAGDVPPESSILLIGNHRQTIPPALVVQQLAAFVWVKHMGHIFPHDAPTIPFTIVQVESPPFSENDYIRLFDDEDHQAGLRTVFVFFNLEIPNGIEELSVTREQVSRTATAFIFSLARYWRKRGREPDLETNLSNRIAVMDPSVCAPLLASLFRCAGDQVAWSQGFHSGFPLAVGLSSGAVIANTVTGSCPPELLAIISFGSIGMILNSFTVYQLLCQLSKTDKRPISDILYILCTEGFDKLLRTLKKQKEFLSTSPCWYAISPLLLHTVIADFSLTNHPVPSRALSQIIAYIDPTQVENMRRLTIRCTMREEKEATYAYQIYVNHLASYVPVATARPPIPGKTYIVPAYQPVPQVVRGREGIDPGNADDDLLNA